LIYRRNKPEVIFCQNPSVVLSLFSLFYAKLFSCKLCIDTHNGGMALESEPNLLKFIAKFLQRHADLIIITNNELKKIVENNHGKAFVLPDNIPEIEVKNIQPYPFKHKYNLVFICTYANDEPYNEVFKAAKIIEQSSLDIGIYVTGKIPPVIANKTYTDNLHLLGFISWDDYDSVLTSCDGIIDLTTRESCLVCGAYEAIAVEKPAILSQTEALQEYFFQGFCFSQNDAKSLATAMISLVEDNARFKKEIQAIKPILNENWNLMKHQLLVNLEINE